MCVSYLIILFLCTFSISSLKFGFLLNDDKGLLKRRFVAFGKIEETTSSKVRSEIHDQLTAYLNEELYRRSFEGIDRKTFLSEPISLSVIAAGKSLIGLKGELSTFLNIFRFSCKRIHPYHSYWRTAQFFSEPIVVLSFNEFEHFKNPMAVTLIEPAFMEEEDNDDGIYLDLLKRDSTISQNEMDEVPLVSPVHNSRSSNSESRKPRICKCGCNIS